MADDTTDPMLSYVIGEVHALLLFAQAAARTHPQPLTLLAALDVLEQKGLAQIEGSLSADATIDGFRFVIDELRKIAKAAAES